MPPRVEASRAMGVTGDGAVHIGNGDVRPPVIHGSSKVKEFQADFVRYYNISLLSHECAFHFVSHLTLA